MPAEKQVFFYFCIMQITKDKIKKALNTGLPGNSAHRKMLPYNRSLTVPSGDKARVKYSSVLLLLSEVEGELSICLIKRPAHMKYHAGQVALPGGRIEKNESPMETALRETWEEIGVEPSQIEVIGRLSDLYIDVSQFMIHPFVGWLATPHTYKINKQEVERIIPFPTSHWNSNTEFAELETVTGRHNVPCIKFEKEIIWGATAMILEEFFEVLEK
ncbi:MAG: coenzyme A pyrophosphatase [Draconibacterium sp.]|nr:MAG: coenzyme A pyrophosphatase [Draconibacterium sp.]